MILLVYDFKATPEGNAERARMRNKITSPPFYGMMMTESVYMCSELVVKLRTVNEWADDTDADIRVFSNIQTSVRNRKKLAKQFVQHLDDVVGEVNDIARDVFQQLKEFEDNIENEKTIRGWYRKVESVTNRYDEIQKLINRVGDDRDEFEFQKLASFMKELTKRYDRVKDMWEHKDWIVDEDKS